MQTIRVNRLTLFTNCFSGITTICYRTLCLQRSWSPLSLSSLSLYLPTLECLSFFPLSFLGALPHNRQRIIHPVNLKQIKSWKLISYCKAMQATVGRFWLAMILLNLTPKPILISKNISWKTPIRDGDNLACINIIVFFLSVLYCSTFRRHHNAIITNEENFSSNIVRELC